MRYDTVFFVDFDGTVTEEETMVGAIKRIAPTALYEEYAEKIKTGVHTLSTGLREAFSRIPSTEFDKIPPYIDAVAARPGFGDFLDAAAEKGFPVVVISGGLRPSVDRKLALYREKLLDVYAADLDLSGPTMALSSAFDDGVELMAKGQVMARYDYRRAACVGDSYTDLKMARICDEVFARDQLAALLQKEEIAYHPWSDFRDIARWVRA